MILKSVSPRKNIQLEELAVVVLIRDRVTKAT